MQKIYLLTVLLASLFIGSIESSEQKRVFSIQNWIKVPDGTLVAPFFNPKDCTSELPWDLLENFSIAAGEIHQHSSIHIMPLVTQITFVLSGSLEVISKEADDDFPKILRAEPNQAVLTKPGTLFQLCNRGIEPCRVLYIVAPAYLFELDATGSVVYDDSFIVQESWEELENNGWVPAHLPSLQSMRQAREESYFRGSTRFN